MEDYDAFIGEHGDVPPVVQTRLSALDVGTAIATVGLVQELFPIRRAGSGGPAVAPPVESLNAAEHNTDYVKDWDSYVGQEPMKQQLRVHIEAAKHNWLPLDHTLLASGMPGVGKTTLARLIAKEWGTKLTMLVPPFSPDTLHRAALELDDFDFLFIDEIHKLADYGKRAAENLLHLLEERTLYLADGVHKLADFTVIGATTDVDKLPETIIDRFPIKPYFQKYSTKEMVSITVNFAKFYDIRLLPETIVTIAMASRSTPRVARELVMAARDMQAYMGDWARPDDLLAFKEIQPDGMTRQHIAYLTGMYEYFGRIRDGKREYVAGESSMMSMLRETKQGVQRLERFLIERGLLDRTPSGRRLTDRGIERARQFVAEGKGN